ncbi:LysE family translocator [Streptomyces sp. SID3343]|uniref:LysE family translocator n=1 Tax=Streptomyces sp. SID3343 TaxID=2690260 RepID=UPI00136BF91F|nr:LysE family translocator [Streptomyces sp. SID3343]MYW01905.1 LysE family transporter [Streptomyces sp. SID3343]
MTHTLLAFLGACTLIAASPGPSSVLIIRHSLQSRRAGLMAVLGNETGVFVWGLAAAFGFTGLLAASRLAYDVMRITGAVVLVGFGVQAIRAARREGMAGLTAEQTATGGAATEPERGAGRRAYRAALTLNLANPKAAVFALSFLPQFVPAGAPQLPTMVGLAAVWALYEIGFYSLYVAFVRRMRSVLSRVAVRRRLEATSGVVMVALGIRMAVDA